MAFTVNPEMTQGPRGNQGWSFHVTRTQEGSDVEETFEVQLPNELVTRIYGEVVGLPGTGLEVVNVRDNWNALETRLSHEIEQRLPPELA